MSRTAAVLKAATAAACGYEAFAICARRTTISDFCSDHDRLGVAVAAGCVAGLAVHFALGRRQLP